VKRRSSHFSSFNVVPYFIYTDLISGLPDPRLVDPGSSLIHVNAYDPKILYQRWMSQNKYSWCCLKVTPTRFSTDFVFLAFGDERCSSKEPYS